MVKETAFVPGHISGFFEICDSDDLMRKGSRNCGLCIDSGVLTEVEVEQDAEDEISIFINGERDPAKTTAMAVKYVLKHFDGKVSIKVRHSAEAPIGSGYGMSGSGPLGAVLALSRALEIDIDREDILTKAHKAEVRCESGLGDVGPEMLGGLVIGLEPGAPPYGKWERIDVPDNIKVICGTKGALPTKGLLNDYNLKRKVKRLGKEAINDLLEDKSIENFMKVSSKFALKTGIFDKEFRKVIEEISSKSPLGASAVLLGKSVFAPCPDFRIGELEEVFSKHFEPGNIMKTSIDHDGASIVN